MRSRAIGALCRGASVSAVLALVLVGCGGGGEEPAGLNATDSNDDGATSESTADTSETETPTDGATEPAGDTDTATDNPDDDSSSRGPAGGQVHEFSDIGVTVIEPDEVPAEAATALERYVDFIYEWRWSLQEVEVSDKIKDIAAPDKLRSLEDSIDYQTKNDIHYGGELTITLEYVDSSERLVAFTGCMDGSDYAWIDDEGRHPIRGETGNDTAVVNATVTNNGGLWLVNEVIEENEAC